MTEELITLATSAAATLVQAMATDAWGSSKAQILRIFRRQRDTDHADIDRALEVSRQSVTAGSGTLSDDLLRQEVDDWTRRFRLLLEQDPTAVQEIRELIAQPTSPDKKPDITQSVKGSQNAQQAVLGFGTQTNYFERS